MTRKRKYTYKKKKHLLTHGRQMDFTLGFRTLCGRFVPEDMIGQSDMPRRELCQFCFRA